MPNLPSFPLVALILNQGPFPPPALPGFFSTTGPSATLPRPACPSRASGCSHASTRQGFPCCVCIPLPCMPSPLPRQNHRLRFSFSSPVTPAFPVNSPGRLLHHSFRGLLSVHSHYGLHGRQVPFRTLYTKGFSRFVTSSSAPVASGRNEIYRAGFAPAGIQRLCTAHESPELHHHGLPDCRKTEASPREPFRSAMTGRGAFHTKREKPHCACPAFSC